jgi:DNA-binding HxlR family transcriptional regulator
MGNETTEAFCPVYQRTVELLGRRWTGAIVRVLMTGVGRFSDIGETVPGLSDRMLAERLKELEAEGIVKRTVHAETPVRVEYSLTDKGRDLNAVMVSISSWAERWEVTVEEVTAR